VRDITPTQLAQPGQLAQPNMVTRAVKAY